MTGDRVDLVRILHARERVRLMHGLQTKHGEHDVLQVRRNMRVFGVRERIAAIGRLHARERGLERGLHDVGRAVGRNQQAVRRDDDVA